MSLNLNYQPEVLVSTEGLTEEEWLNYRRKGIGGSDAAAIMGQSPFCTKRDLYYDKLGIKSVLEEEESNWVAKEVGHRLEDLVAQIFSQKQVLPYSRSARCSDIRYIPLWWQMWISLLNFRMEPLVFWNARLRITIARINGPTILSRSIMSIREGIICRW